MEAIYVKNGRFECEVLDGQIVKLINLDAPNSGNLANNEPLSISKIAFVAGLNDAALNIEFNSPADTCAKQSELGAFIQSKIDDMQKRIER